MSTENCWKLFVCVFLSMKNLGNHYFSVFGDYSKLLCLIGSVSVSLLKIFFRVPRVSTLLLEKIPHEGSTTTRKVPMGSN